MEILIPALVTGIVQYIKTNFGTSEYQTIFATIVVSLVGATLYTAVVAAGYWESFLGILTTASAIYTLIVARFEK